ncbi:hypothetical protein [Turicimonas muris]|uniref:hypothetical protein n=1 Tax=Turicimonas muris TaxID=1796652 RepID=UPI0026034855|nr:hypothetical protein [Turicimonas muris]
MDNMVILSLDEYDLMKERIEFFSKRFDQSQNEYQTFVNKVMEKFLIPFSKELPYEMKNVNSIDDMIDVFDTVNCEIVWDQMFDKYRVVWNCVIPGDNKANI